VEQGFEAGFYLDLPSFSIIENSKTPVNGQYETYPVGVVNPGIVFFVY